MHCARWWLESGQLQWAGSGCPHCVTARRWNAPLEFSVCGAEAGEEQMVEAGRWEGDLLTPLNPAGWQARQDRARARQASHWKCLHSVFSLIQVRSAHNKMLDQVGNVQC